MIHIVNAIRRHSANRRFMQGLVSYLVLLASVDRASASEQLFNAVPKDAALAILIDQPRQTLPTKLIEPILGVAMPSKTVANAIVKCVEHLPVPTLICIYPPMLKGEKADLFVMLDLGSRAFDVDEYVEKRLVPAIEAVWQAGIDPPEKFEIDKAKDVRRATVRSLKEPLFAYTTKDKRALLSTRPLDVLHWRSGAWPKGAWGDRTEVKSLLARLSKDAAVTVLVNPDPLIRLIPDPKPNSNEDLALRILAPTDVKAAAAEFSWDKRAIQFRVLASLADPCRGVLGALSGTGGSSNSFGILPEDFFVVGRVGFTSGASIIDGLYRISDSFDAAISEEYRTEIGEFQKDTGVNFTTEVLGGLTGEAVFGLRVDFMKSPPIAWTVVAPLGNAEQFADSTAKLEKHFGLKAATVPVGELPVRFVRDGGPIAWAIHDKRLIIAESPQTIGEIAAMKTSGISGEPRRETLRNCRKALGGFEQVCVLADVDQFFAKAPIGAMVLGANGTRLLRGTTAGVSFTTRDRVAELKLHWMKNAPSRDKKKNTAQDPSEEPSNDDDAFQLEPLVSLIAETTGNARSQAQRTVVMSNMRAIGQALHIWANDHKNQFPATLEELVTAGIVSIDQFANPYDGTGPRRAEEVTRDGNVIYRPGLTPSSDPGEIVLAEKSIVNGEGANFLFVDGHVEFIPEPQASELIEKIKSGAAEVRR